MRTGTKMLLMADHSNSRGREKDRYGHSEYDMDSRYGNTREHYGSEQYSPRSNYDDAESRRRYRRDSRGRFRSEMDDDGFDDDWRERTGEMESNYPNKPFPVYREDTDMRYRGDRMNQIGFARGDEVNTNYQMNATHKGGSEMEYRPGSYMPGRASSSGGQMTKEMAEEWTRGMKNEDGTKGPHWKVEQVKQLMAQKGLQYDPWEFFAILNAMYSDYCAVFKKHGVNTIDMYVDLATAWLNDSDAVDDKAALYYECIVKK